eukprot:8365459-Pyramimonas_sp.AAC.1
MLYQTELLDVFVSVQSIIAVLILSVSHSTIGVFNALDRLVNGVISIGHIGIINMFGRKQVATRLDLLVAGRGSETKTSCGPSELQ